MKIKNRKSPLTPKERQQKIRQMISAAFQAGTTAEHFWFVGMIVPPKKRQGPDDDGDGRVACWPGIHVPVIPLTDDPTGDYAQLLAELFTAANDRESFFYPSLSTKERLDFFEADRWYIWGDMKEDRICGHCGQVYQAIINAPRQLCDCQSFMRPTPEPAGFYRVVHAFVDDVIYERRIY